MEKNEKISWWEKLVARCGVVAVRRPPKAWQSDWIKDFVMAFHWRGTCRAYRFDRHYDLVSKKEHFSCGGCGTMRETAGVVGYSPFLIAEAGRIAAASQTRFKSLFAYWLIATNLGKHLPDNRGGKTSGKLEWEASTEIAFALAEFYANK